jgi:sigma-B regulation protein RsbQ
LILQCSDDIIAPCAVGEYMHRVMPRSTLKVVRNVGHCPHLSEPQECARLISEFIASLEPGREPA